MYLTGIPYNPNRYALVSPSGGVLVLSWAEAMRIGDVPFRSWHSIPDETQRRVIGAARTQTVEV